MRIGTEKSEVRSPAFGVEDKERRKNKTAPGAKTKATKDTPRSVVIGPDLLTSDFWLRRTNRFDLQHRTNLAGLNLTGPDQAKKCEVRSAKTMAGAGPTRGGHRTAAKRPAVSEPDRTF
jgi:hypothetical protein